MTKEFIQKIGKNILLLSIAILCVVLCGAIYFIYRRNSAVEISGFQSVPTHTILEDKQPAEKITIYITGEVNRPGVYELDQGSRIIDAVRIAEGASGGADLESLNLAALLTDAQHIVIPALSINTGDGTESEDPKVNKVTMEKDGLININTADISKLSTLPGIGDAIAKYIIDYRDSNGGFKAIDDLKNVTRIGDKTFEKIKDKIYVE